MDYDFSGYVTKNMVKCADGRTILPDAFKNQDGTTVPLIYHHLRNELGNILGHVKLENRPDGVYGYASFNGTPNGQLAKTQVEHKDLDSMSIFGVNILEDNKLVKHGLIQEVSLVLMGANPEARIDNVVIQHDFDEDETLSDKAVIYMNQPITIKHEESQENELETEEVEGEVEEDEDDAEDDAEVEHAAGDDDETIGDIFDTLSPTQQDAVYALLNQTIKNLNLEHSLDSSEGNTSMTHNIFDGQAGEAANLAQTPKATTLTHDQLTAIQTTALNENLTWQGAVLKHAVEYGIENIDLLFPDAKAIDNEPEMILREMAWVAKVLDGTKHLPWSRIKNLWTDLTHEEARAKGYIKATMKKEQWISLSKRETGPKTIYKKQKLDRDDEIDATTMNVIAFLWREMRIMLKEEIARAILIGDGREPDDEDKIDETKIRPIAHDDEFYTDVVVVPTGTQEEALVEAVLRARPNYKGVGQPTAFMTQAVMIDMLLVKDKMGRRLYRTVQELAAELMVDEIVTVPVMEGATHTDGDILMILVKLSDYSVGTDKGGEITTFEDFDIDFNQKKFLIEGRMSGALTKHKTAQVFVRTTGTLATPVAPSFNAATGVVTIPTTTGVDYQIDGVTVSAGAQTAIAAGESVEVVAVPKTGYNFAHNIDNDWTFTRDAA